MTMRTWIHRVSVATFVAIGSVLLLAQATHITTGGTLPASCRVGDIYEKTGTSAGLYRCSATDTWSSVGGGVTSPVGAADGGTGQTTPTADTVLVGDGSVWNKKALPSCSNGTTSKLLYDTSTDSFSCGTDQSGGGGSGAVVQVVNTQTGAVATGTTGIPADDTIPQNTEGDEYMTLAITPTSASNDLLIDVVWNGTNSSANTTLVVALFRDSDADALAVAVEPLPSSGGFMGQVVFRHRVAAGSTSATTFKVRAGGNLGGTTTFNGSGTRYYGGRFASSITITEVVP